MSIKDANSLLVYADQFTACVRPSSHACHWSMCPIQCCAKHLSSQLNGATNAANKISK